MLHQLHLSAKLNTVAHLDAQANKKPKVSEVGAFQYYHFLICIGNEKPRGAWKTLLDSEFGGGNALVSALRADPILDSETLFEKMRYSLYKIRTFFETNPDEE